MRRINSDDYKNKVLGCWMGKNCGGTLGAPLEQAYGLPDPFDVWWYPELREGGIPNDDLEMQLIWLKALEEVGPGLKSADLVQYWLDHIGYNWDEYGLSKTNMRLGLLPPVTGSYNNWFVDCMGCPIRSEIWACAAPGFPEVAVRLAYEDAICDHAGGESVYGEMFNTSIESAAFVVGDRQELVSIGRTYVPDGSITARTIDAALDAHRDGVDWKAARRRVYDAAPNYNAMYSPINMGFQVVALLYGTDFGDTICKAVNCGYDTDCTGATVGSILGIIHGAKGLPAKWTDPLGASIATNASWGGLKHIGDGPNPIPAALDELTERTIAQARRVLAANGIDDDSPCPESFRASAEIEHLWKSPPCAVSFAGNAIDVAVDYIDTPAITPGAAKRIAADLTNRRADNLEGKASLCVPDGWRVTPPARNFAAPPHETTRLEWLVTAPSAAVATRNLLSLRLDVSGRTAERDIPIVLVGSRAMRVSGPFATGGTPSLDTNCPPDEVVAGGVLTEAGRPGVWVTRYSDTNRISLPEITDQPGIMYIRQFLFTTDSRRIRIGVPATCPTELRVNGEHVLTCAQPRLVRPNYDGDGASYVDTALKAGWNELLIKFARTAEQPPFDAYLTLSEATKYRDGLIDVVRTRFPWEEAGR